MLKNAVINVKLFPVFCGSALANKGVQILLNAVNEFLPSPLDVAAIKGTNPDTEKEEERKPNDSEPFSALILKIMTDPFVGKLAYFRIYSGIFFYYQDRFFKKN